MNVQDKNLFVSYGDDINCPCFGFLIYFFQIQNPAKTKPATTKTDPMMMRANIQSARPPLDDATSEDTALEDDALEDSTSEDTTSDENSEDELIDIFRSTTDFF